MGVIQYNNVFESAVTTTLPVPIQIDETTDMVMGALNSGVGADADCFAVCQMVIVEN
jgi:hypothetical protein